jgi:hypothetical protein
LGTASARRGEGSGIREACSSFFSTSPGSLQAFSVTQMEPAASQIFDVLGELR